MTSNAKKSAAGGTEPVPAGQTARRLQWHFLPAPVRELVAAHCGSPIVSAESRNAGYTPGFASVLTCEDGSKHFVKAASVKAQKQFAHSYREEARKITGLPDGLPAPKLRWLHDADDWVALGFDFVEGRNPRRPWRPAELAACLDTVEQIADQLTPAPAELELDSIVDEFADWPALWDKIRENHPELEHADEAAALAASYAQYVVGDTLVHTDVRDDNFLIAPDGVAWLCDWNWPCTGAPWLDTLFMLLGPRGDGVDVETILRERRLTRDVPAEAIDAVLALVAGMFLKYADDPVPPNSPWIRAHQRWQGEAVWKWLSERRGWGS